MSEVKVNNGNIEDALKRFKRQCARNGVLQEVRKRECYEKPSVRRKKKSEAARKESFNWRGVLYALFSVRLKNNCGFRKE